MSSYDKANHISCSFTIACCFQPVNGYMSLCKVALNSESVDAIQLLAFQRNLFVVNYMSWYTLFFSFFDILGGF